MKRSFFAILTAALFLTGCYRDDLWNMHNELESLENTTIASLSEQADRIESSISNLNELNTSIQEFITALEASSLTVAQNLAETQKLIDSFKQASESSIDANTAAFMSRIEDLNSSVMTQVGTIAALASSLDSDGDSIQKKIDALQQYLKLYAEMDWVEGTFATLSIQNGLISELESIKERISNLNSASTNLDLFLTATIDEAFEGFREQFTSDLTEAMYDVVGSYTYALAELSRSLKAANSEAVSKAVEENEKSVMSWINDQLKGYYKVEQAEAQWEAFDIMLGTLPEGKASFQVELDELFTAVEDARKAVTEAYDKAIKDAIEKHEGVFSPKIASELGKLNTEHLDPLAGRVSTLKSQVKTLQDDVTELDGRIKSAEEQKAAISSSISVLQKYNDSLEEYIAAVKSSLEGSDKKNFDALMELIDALDALVKGKDAKSLPSQISALEDLVGDLSEYSDSTDVASWVSGTLASIRAQFDALSLTTEVDGIFNALKTTLGTQDASIKKLEDGLADLMKTNESKIKGWISDKFSSYFKLDGEFYNAAKLEGLLSGLDTEIKSYFDQGDKTIESRIDSLSNALSAKKTELTTEYEGAISTAISVEKGKVDKRIIDDFSTVDTDVTGLTNKAASLKTVVDSLRTALNGYMNDVYGETGLKARMEALEAFLAAKNAEDASYASLKAVVDDILASIGALKTKYADKDAFDKICEYINGTLKEEAGKVQGLLDDLDTVEGKLDAIKTFVDGFDGTDSSLYEQLDKIGNSIDSLKKYVFGDGTEGIESFQSQIDAINAALFGAGGSSDSPAKGSIAADLARLNAQITANHISSITYVPSNLDQTETIVYKEGSSTVTADFRFIIKPSGLLSLVKDDLVLKYMPIGGGTLTPFTVEKVAIEGDVIQFSVSAPASDILSGGEPAVCAALFYSSEDSEGNVLSSFTSKFIFLSVFEDESTGDIPYDGDRIIRFPAEGGSVTFTVGTKDQTVANKNAYWLVKRLDRREGEGLLVLAYNAVMLVANADNAANGLLAPEWISVSPEYSYPCQQLTYPFINCYEGVQEITITAESNTSSEPRSGKLVFRLVFQDFDELRESATGAQDLVIYIEQDGKLD